MARPPMLLTKADIKALPARYSTENTPIEDKIIPVKFFNAFGTGRWYIIEMDHEDKDTLFCYVTGLSDDELGYVSLAELASLRKYGAPAIERDRHWDRKTTLGQVMRYEVV